MSIHRSLLGLLAVTALVPTRALAQESGAPGRRVISIGNYPRVDGIAVGSLVRADVRGVTASGVNIVPDNPAGRRVLPIINW